MRRRAAGLVLPTLALALAACGSTGTPRAETTTAPTTPLSSAESTSPAPAPSTSQKPSSIPTPAATAWTEVPGSVKDVVTANSVWTLTVSDDQSHATLSGPRDLTIAAPSGFSISDAMLDDRWAVVVASDDAMAKPSVATVIPLAAPARRFTLDDTSQPPTVFGGAWTLGQSRLEHATRANHGRYCLATVDLATRASQIDHCSEPLHGFNNVRLTPSGLTLMNFDAHHPSCRTLLQVGEAGETPLPHAKPCIGWEALAMSNGAIWTEVADQSQIQNAEVFTDVGDSRRDLGPGNSSSLIWCGNAAWWSQDPATDTGPAKLLKFDGTSVTTAYTSPVGPATISAPRCGGDRISVTALTQHGDRQVTAAVD